MVGLRQHIPLQVRRPIARVASFVGLRFSRASVAIMELPLILLSPSEVAAWERDRYRSSRRLQVYASKQAISKGLSADESEIVELCRMAGKDVLVLGVGGGREALSLSKLGCRVTGVDTSPEMVEACAANAARACVEIDLRLLDPAEQHLGTDMYDFIVGFYGFYSIVMGQERRVRLLRHLQAMLRPAGTIVLSFFIGRPRTATSVAHTAWRRGYEYGDTYYGEPVHLFTKESFAAETREAGLTASFVPLSTDYSYFIETYSLLTKSTR